MNRIRKSWLCGALTLGLLWLNPANILAQSNEPAELSATNSDSGSIETNLATNAIVSPPANNPVRRGPVVSIWGSASAAKGEAAETVVAIGGNATAEGHVREAVVAVGGNAEANGEVGQAVVAVGGDATARGKVRDVVVAVAGDVTVEGQVGDAVVAVMGDVNLGADAVVNGDVVAVGGKINRAEGAQVKGQLVEISVAKYPILAPLQGVADWLRDCGLKFRLLAPRPGWYWIFVGAMLLLYLLIAAALPRPVAACVTELRERPATTFLLGLLTKFLIPLVFLILAITGIGVVVIPFIMAAIFFGALIGKVALFEWIGGGLCNLFGAKVARPILALLAGFVLISLLYMVPFLSLLVYSLLGLWALGAVVTATFSGARKETPPRPPYVPTNHPPATAPPMGAPDFPPPPAANINPAPEPPGAAPFNTDAPPPLPPANPPVAEALVLPRAGFWERMGAAFLDLIIIAILSAFVGGLPLGLLVALAYFAGLWAWKGTTIGGIVLNLKVVRLDGHPVSFAVAFVRGMMSTFSILVFFVGFLWMLFDQDRQTWHDKIAGTVVVRSPRPMSLVCI